MIYNYNEKIKKLIKEYVGHIQTLIIKNIKNNINLSESLSVITKSLNQLDMNIIFTDGPFFIDVHRKTDHKIIGQIYHNLFFEDVGLNNTRGIYVKINTRSVESRCNANIFKEMRLNEYLFNYFKNKNNMDNIYRIEHAYLELL